MKVKEIFQECAMLLAVFLIVACSSDDEFPFEKAKEEQLADLKVRAIRIATDYGLANIKFDDNELMKNLNISDEEIEQTMKMFAGLKGHYMLSGKEGQTFKMHKRQPNRMRKVSPVIENWSGSAFGTYSNYDFSLDISLNYYYSTMEKSEISGSISVRYSWYDEDNETYQWEDDDVEIVEEYGDFSGMNQFSYSAIIKYSKNGFVLNGEVICDYSGGVLYCEYM